MVIKMVNVTDHINVTVTDELTTPTNSNYSDDCKRLHFDSYIPWDNPDNIVSVEFEAFFERLKGAIILPIFFVIGGPANVINVAVFYQQGLRERINLCLFALSLMDGLYLCHCMFFNGEMMYFQFISSDERNGPFQQFMFNHNLGGFFGFTWTSQVISAIIASERCFCVVSPLRSQTILTTRTMAIVLIVVFVVVVGVYFLVVTRYRMECVYDPVTGDRFSMLGGGPFYYKHQAFFDYLDSMVYGVGIPGTTMLVVMVTTIVTAVKLRQAIAWRSETSGTLSPREVALTKMLIGSSVLFLLCVIPIAMFRFVQLFIADLKPSRRYQNLFFTILWFLEIPSYINSSFNICIYYSMGSKYRHTVKALLCRTAGAKVKGKGGAEKPQPISDGTTVTCATSI